MKKIDLKKEMKTLYQASGKEPIKVEVPTMSFLMIDGKGDPNESQSFKDATEALFPLAYTLKFMLKKGSLAIDYGVMPLEGLWWAEDMSKFKADDKSNWKWTLMMMQPAFITGEMVASASAEVKKKKNPIALSRIRFEAFDEGLAAQILHSGPFSEEGPTIERLHQFLEASGYKNRGKHHEIYLSDPRKVAPAKMKTIIRQPISLK
jgi:hypothetical protein